MGKSCLFAELEVIGNKSLAKLCWGVVLWLISASCKSLSSILGLTLSYNFYLQVTWVGWHAPSCLAQGARQFQCSTRYLGDSKQESHWLSSLLCVRLIVWSPQESGGSFIWGKCCMSHLNWESPPIITQKQRNNFSALGDMFLAPRHCPLLFCFIKLVFTHKPFLKTSVLIISYLAWEMSTIHHPVVTSSSKHFWVSAHGQHCWGSSLKPPPWVPRKAILW